MSDSINFSPSSENLAFVEEMHIRYTEDPQSVSESWRDFFVKQYPESAIDHEKIRESIAYRAQYPNQSQNLQSNVGIEKQFAVTQLVNQYRVLGARHADINPLQYEIAATSIPDLLPQTYGLNETDMESVFVTDIKELPQAKLKDIIDFLNKTYCGTIAIEYMHITHMDQRQWLKDHFEASRRSYSISRKKTILENLMAAEILEKYLHTRYVGQKRFSLEGGDSLIPLLYNLLQISGSHSIKEIVIGMAHRGRLNVLVNILGKQPSELFMEFEGKSRPKGGGSGDVKYHMGFSSTLKSVDGNNIHLALSFNPSHLEIVGPVVEGSVRARQDRRKDEMRKQVLAIQVHGDAAFAGQGVVMEGLNFAQVRGYKTGGTVHIIVNNQIGFTTSTPDDARSTFFCTDIGKMVEIPIIHVNADDIENVIFASETAFLYRQKFGVDVIIDMVCFRRHGHNEQDEPLMTQPLMYKKIAKHPGTPQKYRDYLIENGYLSSDEVQKIADDYRKRLESGQAHPNVIPTETSHFVNWQDYSLSAKDWDWKLKDKTSLKKITAYGKVLSTLPEDFSPHNNLKRLVKQRQEMANGTRPLDWGMAENLAYADLLTRGYKVRLSGQDCGRGTFSHRHAVWHDQNRSKRDGGNYVPLQHLNKNQSSFLVIDSILSEEAVLAFEYGYSTTDPTTLVIWEAQFGDFANGAQVVIDQFIASGEAKWQRHCGLVMLLPHGYEGQGPEHSSARLERYLQLCAEYNIQVCVPSLPSQIYHLLQRQMLRNMRRPLIVITPKSLLRHPEATSTLEDLSQGDFQTIIGEIDDTIVPNAVKRLVFCSGKVYYDLLAARNERQQKDVAICRIEQLYPFPHLDFKKQINIYKKAKQIVWCQEEPGNQGAWHRLQHYFRRYLLKDQVLTYALRPSSASPAVGFAQLHKQQQAEVVDAALNINSVV